VSKIILDLCGGTGAWSAPYKEAGYDVRIITLPKFDLYLTRFDVGKVVFDSNSWNLMNVQVKDIYGILAAPPCTMFSLARTTAKTPRDLDKGMELVKVCLNIIWKSKPNFWVLENPLGFLRHFLGKPALTFDASEFGGNYNKTTDLWGYFNEPKKTRDYIRFASTDKNTRKLPPLPEGYKPVNETNQAARRAITPRGFAEAFYKANK
jgi:site-specific DNA-cytosine methylase